MVTPEALSLAIKGGDASRCVRLLCDCTEFDRRAARPSVEVLNKQFWAEQTAGWPPGGTFAWSHRLNALTFAHFGTATLSEIKRVRLSVEDNAEGVIAILEARRPQWATAWLGHHLESASANWWSRAGHRWLLARRLIRMGLCDVPDTEAYIVALMAYEHETRGEKQTPPLPEMLLADPALLDVEIWRLFEVEGNAVGSLAKSRLDWAGTLCQFSQRGLLDRQRLLDASLSALQRDFSDHHAGWYSRFFELMKPTLEERKQREGRCRELLSSNAPTTVAFALKSLHKLGVAGALDYSLLLPEIPRAMSARSKSTVVLAIRLARMAASDQKIDACQSATAVAEALFHQRPDVQEEALKVLETLEGNFDGPLLQRVREAADGIATSLRDRLRALLGSFDVIQPPEQKVGVDLNTLQKRLSCLNDMWMQRAGISSLVSKVQGERGPIEAIDLTVGGFPRLDPDRAISEVTNLDELLELLTSALEVEPSVEDYERILDGISRLCADRPAEFERRTAPVSRRAVALIGNYERPSDGWFECRSLPHLVRAWLVPEPQDRKDARKNRRSTHPDREEDVARRAARGSARPLLSLPTHEGGWIDPRVAVQRFRHYLRSSHISLEPETPESGTGFMSRLAGAMTILRGRSVANSFENSAELCDVLLAILRLAPDGRVKALEDAADLEGELGSALRFALGDPIDRVGPTAALWIAACRARDPRVDSHPVAQAFPNLGPDSGVAATSWLLDEPLVPARGWGSLYVWTVPRPPPNIPSEHFTVSCHSWQTDPRCAHAYRRGMVSFDAAQWPSGKHSLLPRGAQAIVDNLDWWEAHWGDVAYIELLLDPDLELDQMGRLLLGAGLCASEPGQVAMATDVLISAIEDGRVDGATLSDALALPLRVKHVKPQRWARPLGEAARASELHSTVIRDGLIDILSELGARKPAEYVGLLELLNELCVQSGRGVEPEDAREALLAITGSGKSAKLAKALLALSDRADAADFDRLAAIRALEGRIARAERWQRWAVAA